MPTNTSGGSASSTVDALITPHGTSWPSDVNADATTGSVALRDDVSASAIISSFHTSTKLNTMPPSSVLAHTGSAICQNTAYGP